VKDRAELLRFLQMYFAVSVVIGICGAITLWFFSDWIVTFLFGAKYLASTPLLKIWAVGMLPVSPFSIFFAGSLIPFNASKAYFYTTLVGAVVTVVSIPLLIHFLGLSGVPFASILSELALVGTGGYFFIRRLEMSFDDVIEMINVPAAFRSLVAILRSKSVAKHVGDA
jgi:O-antigen/teichoic acid export membrane protein